MFEHGFVYGFFEFITFGLLPGGEPVNWIGLIFLVAGIFWLKDRYGKKGGGSSGGNNYYNG